MPDTITANLIDLIRQRLTAGKRVRRSLPHRGRVHIDRPLPFLVIYRRCPDLADPGTDRLVVGEGSYLIASTDEAMQAPLGNLIGAVVEVLAERFNAVLLLELWSGEMGEGEAGSVRPTFRVHMPADGSARPTVAALVRGLREIRLLSGVAKVVLHRGGRAPPRLPSLLAPDQAQRHACLMLGLEVPPVYRDPQTNELFPRMLHRLHRGLSRALQQTFFAFARVQTRATVEHYQALGRRAVVQAVWQVDRQLAEIDGAFDFLLSVTPVNVAEALASFKASRFMREPAFHYRLLPVDPDLLKRRLYMIPIEKVEDPALGELFREKRIELDRQITMLEDRETRRFFYGSMQLYEGVDEQLLELAEQILDRLPPRRGTTRRESIGAASFARRARDEIEAYRRVDGAINAVVQIRGDVPGLVVSNGALLISEDLEVPTDRVEALIAHEVGTHLLTYFNGMSQPLQLLHCGLPGYEELQEGLAVLSEWLVGGLNRQRLRLLAARVLAVRRLITGASFVQIYQEMHEQYGFSAGVAFLITMRVFRGGGFTKDVIYLRGLARLLAHLGRETSGQGELEELLVGKISFASLPIVRELRWRQVSRPPLLRPHHLQTEVAVHKLRQLRAGLAVIDLLQEELSEGELS